MSSATHSPGFVVMLASRHEVAVRTLAFEVNRPLNFQFKAGQTADLTWIDPPETDGEGNTRTFSIASAPHEPQLLFATHLRDTAFKRVLEKTALGTALRMQGPFGNNAAQQRQAACGFDRGAASESHHFAASSGALATKSCRTRSCSFVRTRALLLTKHLKGVSSPEYYVGGPIYYVAGPLAMVEAIRTAPSNAGIDDDDIQSEEFAGF